jgi:heptaprenyl diphosphate synthase
MMTLLFGNVMMLLYSLAGATLSLCAMALLKRIGWFSPVGVSVTGGVCHNIGQILVAMVVLRTRTIGYYLPVLTVTGTVAGILVGFLGVLLMNKIGNVAEKGGEM